MKCEACRFAPGMEEEPENDFGSRAALIVRLREYAEWADANEWEVPICLGDDLRAAAEMLQNDMEVQYG